MELLSAFLFGRFTLLHSERTTTLEIGSQKARELFCYLLLNRKVDHHREKLATLLWPDARDNQARQYLRRALWQLQSSLSAHGIPVNNLFLVQDEWVRVNRTQIFWADVEQFNRAFHVASGKQGNELDTPVVHELESAATLYRGDLLENWYYDWCLIDRGCFREKYLIVLDKLIGHFASVADFESGIVYATESLRCDEAREITYRGLMNLYYGAGDRSGALRAFERCSELIDKEFGVKPDQATQDLYKSIKQGMRLSSPVEAAGAYPIDIGVVCRRLEMLDQSLRVMMAALRRELETFKRHSS